MELGNTDKCDQTLGGNRNLLVFPQPFTSDVNLTSRLTLPLLGVTDLTGSVASAPNSSSRSLIETCDGLSFTDVTSVNKVHVI